MLQLQHVSSSHAFVSDAVRPVDWPQHPAVDCSCCGVCVLPPCLACGAHISATYQAAAQCVLSVGCACALLCTCSPVFTHIILCRNCDFWPHLATTVLLLLPHKLRRSAAGNRIHRHHTTRTSICGFAHNCCTSASTTAWVLFLVVLPIAVKGPSVALVRGLHLI